MPTSLETVRTKLLVRIYLVDRAFERHLIQPSVKLRSDRYALQEGLISHLWQYWNQFSRDVVVASVKGALTASGSLTVSQHSARSESEIAYIARKLSRAEPITNVVPLSGSHLEPTWGDASKINRIVYGIGCSNANSLLAGFGISASLSDLQLCRNACSHTNLENIGKLKRARVRYTETTFHHPSDFMFWVEPATKDFVWRTWIDDMEIASSYAIS